MVALVAGGKYKIQISHRQLEVVTMRLVDGWILKVDGLGGPC